MSDFDNGAMFAAIAYEDLIRERDKKNAELCKLVSDLMFCRRNNCLTCSHGRICDLRIEERVRKFGIEVDE